MDRSLFERYYRIHQLGLRGQSLPFAAEASLKAARVLELSAWYLVSQAGTPEDLERDLVLHVEPVGAAEHLSVDLTLQYLPVIYQRARVLFAGDRLPALLEELLRRWPLSGVLADVPESPTADLDFGGHHGLLMLYAERLAEHFKPRWVPHGLGASYLDLVWSELGRDPALLKGGPS